MTESDRRNFLWEKSLRDEKRKNRVFEKKLHWYSTTSVVA